MIWDNSTHDGRVSPSTRRRDFHSGQSHFRHYGSGPSGPQRILYANGDVKSTAPVEAILHQAEAAVVHPGSIAECLACIDRGDCNLIVINVPRPEVEGLDLLNEARRRAPWVPIIVMVDRGRIEVAVRAIKAGAVDCIERPPEPHCLRSAVSTALRDARGNPQTTPLTSVELAVLYQFLQGRSNRETAVALKRSQRTIEVHRSNIMRKLQADGPVDLVRKAIAAGLAEGFFGPEPLDASASESPGAHSPLGQPAQANHSGGARVVKPDWDEFDADGPDTEEPATAARYCHDFTTG